jgi:tetratricopeptide (TPR) repeat protein
VLLGRSAVLDRAEALIAGLSSTGRGGLLWVHGEAGIGKTTVLDAIGELGRRSGATVLRGTAAEESSGPPAFWLWTQILRQAGAGDAGALVALGGARARRAADLVDPDIATDPDQAGNRFPLFDGVSAVVEGLVEEFPVVLLLDDLHWADPGSLHLLRFLLPALAGRPVLAVCGWRDHEVSSGTDRHQLASEIAAAGESWPLAGLGPEDVARLVELTSGQQVDAEEAAAVTARTNGNPLFVAEMARLAAARGATVAEMVPETAQGAIRRRVARLAQSAQDVLTAAAVLGLRPPLDGVRALGSLDGDDLVAGVDALVGGGLARQEGDRLALSHALVRDAVYDATPVSRRRELHLAAADLPGLAAAEVAGHLVRAMPLADRDRVVAAIEDAARAARDAQAWEESVRLYRQALDLVPPGEPARPRLLRGVGAALLDAGDLDAARVYYREAAGLARGADDAVALAEAALGFAAGLGGFEVRLVDREQNDLLREALDLLDDDEKSLRVHLMARLVVGLAFTDDAGQIPELADAAVALARQAGDARALGAALAAHCDAFAGPDHVALREAEATEIVAIARAIGDVGLELLGLRLRIIARWERGAMREAATDVSTFTGLAERLGQPLYGWYVPLWRGLAAHLRGDLDEMARCAEEVALVGSRGESQNAAVLAVVQGIWPLLERGLTTQAIRRLTSAFGELPELAPDGGSIIALFYGTEPETRRRHLPHLPRLVDALPRDKEWLPNLAGVVGGLHEGGLGGPEVAYLYELLAPYADLFLVDGIGAAAPGSLERPLGLLAGLVGDHEAAVAHLERAIAANEHINAGLATANSRRALAEALESRGSRGDLERAAHERGLALAFYTTAGIAERVAELTSVGTRAGAPISPTSPTSPGAESGTWERTGAGWTITFRGRTASLPAVKGMGDLARLLDEPGREVHVLDLVAPVGGAAPGQGDLGEVLDDRARAAYQRRLAELDERIAEADSDGNADRSAAALEERDFLLAELAGAYGLGGRPRRAGDPAERARTTVTSRIRDALGRIEAEHPELGRHLRSSVRTGTFCCYAPELPVAWDVRPTSSGPTSSG